MDKCARVDCQPFLRDRSATVLFKFLQLITYNLRIVLCEITMNSNGRFVPRTPRREKSNMSSGSESERARDPVNVFCRLRNLKDEKDECCIELISPTVLSISCPSESRVLRKDLHYTFKHIFTSYASQKEIFEHVALPLLNDLLKGKNGLLFTYGVTGSGKTYTLTGDPHNPGIMPRAIDTIFNSIAEYQAPKFVIKSDRMNGFEVQSVADAADDRAIEARKNFKTASKRKAGGDHVYSNDGMKILDVNGSNLFAVFISYTEIYNNTVYDLLDDSGGKMLQSKILREDSQKNMYVNGVVEVEVKSAAETFELFNAGQKRKRMGHTLLNAESSRSHSIFNVRVVQLEQVMHNSQGERVIPDKNLLKVGQLSFVDLAGSERCSRTQNTGVRLKEASSINNSLMSLRSCLEILRDNQMNNANRLVPYRDSRLTLLFKNYFDGEGKVQMIVCCNPATQDYEENLQVMKFAELTQDVKLVRPESRYTPYRRAEKVKVGKVNKVKTAAPLVLGPKIPLIKLDFENTTECLSQVQNLLRVLRTRKEKNTVFAPNVQSKCNEFRKRLIEFNQDHVLKLSELRSIQQQYKKEKKKSQNLEVKILQMESIYDEGELRSRELMDTIAALRGKLDEKDLKLNQNLLDKEKQKHKFALKQEKMQQELDERMRKQREHLNAMNRAKDEKLRIVRDILDNDVDMADVQTETEVVRPVSSQAVVRPQSSQVSQPKTPTSNRRNMVQSTNRRRSRSVGEVWLEHNSVKPVPLGTVMQPSMKKRKSVTKLSKATDITNPKQSKYCLIAQEPDVDGEVETKVYKADIVPTCGGGAQVIFNDVERLRQESPTGTPTK